MSSTKTRNDSFHIEVFQGYSLEMYHGIALLRSVNLVLNKVAVAVANVGQDKAEENSWSLFAAVSRQVKG